MKRILTLLMGLLILTATACEEQKTGSTFNHNRTMFPLTGSHQAVSCRECHKDGAITTLPTACFSCHPMGATHTKNLGDCDLCHNSATFSAAYYNHHRSGVSIAGQHKVLVADNCANCHKNPNSYAGVDFTCYKCHQPPSIDGTVHTSTTANCEICHNQSAWSPATFAPHNAFQTKLRGAHLGLTCNTCHPNAPATYVNVDYRNGTTFGGLCADCHRGNYVTGESEHTSLAADANCGRCHGYNTFDD